MAKRRVQFVALVLVVAAGVILLVVPTYMTVTSSSDGPEVTSSQTMLAVVGPWLFVVLLAPVLFAALPLFARGRAWAVLSVVSAILLGGFVLLSLLTIGIFFVPGAVLSVIAACLPARPRVPAAA